MTDREAFEAWATSDAGGWHVSVPRHKDADGEYIDIDLRADFRTWQAATAAERERAAKVAETCITHDFRDQLLNSDIRKTCAAAIRKETT